MFGSSKKTYIKALKRLSDIGIALSEEHNLDRLLEMILENAKSLANADNGTLYLRTEDGRLKFSIMQSESLEFARGGTTGKAIAFAPVKLFRKDGTPNHKSLVAHVALTGDSVNIEDLYNDEVYDFASTEAFDRLKGYRSKSALAVPLKDRSGKVQGVLHLVNARNKRGKIISFSEEVQHFVESLSSQASISISHATALNEQKEFIDGVIRMMALAIDNKSPHTSHHCASIPEIVELIAKTACKERTGYFKDFDLDDDGWYELKVAAWLHDCGKLSTPLHILEKPTKLKTIFDRIEMVGTRLEVVARDLEIACLKNEISKQAYKKHIEELRADWRFLKKLNKGVEYVSDKKMAHLEAIAAKDWYPKILNGKKADGDVKPFFTEDERYCLSVRKGTLTPEERTIINQHIDVTIDMLESLPFPSYLKRVPEYAGGHHEKMDGTGFPKGLTRDQMSIPARMMAVADIFEALTSSDRPYKKSNTLSQALGIMGKMYRNNHIDPDIFELFVKRKIYFKYAKKFLKPEQIDEVDMESVLGR